MFILELFRFVTLVRLVTRRLYFYFNLCACDVAVLVSAGGVNFPPSSWCSAGVWLWGEKGVDF